MHKDILIDCKNPQAVDEVLQQVGVLMSQDGKGGYEKKKGYYIARILNGDVGFIKFMLENQGYAKFIEEL